MRRAQMVRVNSPATSDSFQRRRSPKKQKSDNESGARVPKPVTATNACPSTRTKWRWTVNWKERKIKPRDFHHDQSDIFNDRQLQIRYLLRFQDFLQNPLASLRQYQGQARVSLQTPSSPQFRPAKVSDKTRIPLQSGVIQQTLPPSKWSNGETK